MLRQWIQYLNRCVDALAYDVVEALGDSTPFSLKQILVDLEWVRYARLILPNYLADLLEVRQSAGGGATRGGVRGGGGSNGDGGIRNI